MWPDPQWWIDVYWGGVEKTFFISLLILFCIVVVLAYEAIEAKVKHLIRYTPDPTPGTYLIRFGVICGVVAVVSFAWPLVIVAIVVVAILMGLGQISLNRERRRKLAGLLPR